MRINQYYAAFLPEPRVHGLRTKIKQFSWLTNYAALNLRYTLLYLLWTYATFVFTSGIYRAEKMHMLQFPTARTTYQLPQVETYFSYSLYVCTGLLFASASSNASTDVCDHLDRNYLMIVANLYCNNFNYY